MLRRHPARAGAGGRPLLHARRRARATAGRPATSGSGSANFGAYPMVNGLTRLASRFLGEPGPRRRPEGPDRRGPRRRGGAEAGLVTFTPDDIDWDDEVRIASRSAPRSRPTRSPAWRPRSASAAPRPSRARSSRRLGVAELDLPAPERGRRAGALRSTARASGPSSTGGERDGASTTPSASPTTSASPRTAASCARSRSGSRSSSTGGARWGPRASRRTTSTSAPAISVDAQGWAHFDYVKMPEYRWGHLPGRARAGPHDRLRRPHGQPAWQEVPGEHRGTLRRLIVTQGDTEPASVEQQRQLGGRARRSTTSATSSRSTWRRAGTSGRWSTCSTPTSGATAARRPRRCCSAARATATSRASSAPSTSRRRTGCRSSCSRSSPTATASTSSQPGRERLRSAVAHVPLHAHRGGAPHVRGRDGRRARRAAHLRADARARTDDDVRGTAASTWPTIQRYLNFHYSVSLDLFGGEISTNAANFYTLGLKGRFEEDEEGPTTTLEGRRTRSREARRRRAS